MRGNKALRKVASSIIARIVVGNENARVSFTILGKSGLHEYCVAPPSLGLSGRRPESSGTKAHTPDGDNPSDAAIIAPIIPVISIDTAANNATQNPILLI